MSNYRAKILGCITLLLVALASVSAQAGSPTFVVGVQDFQNYLPYSQVKGGDYQGFNRELLDRFAAQQGYRFVYRPYPIKRLYLVFLQGRVDFKYPDNPYWSAKLKSGQEISYSDAVVNYIDGVMVPKAAKGQGMGRLKTLGVKAGYTPRGYIESSQRGDIAVRELFGFRQLLGSTLSGRVDGAYANISVSRHYLNTVMKRPGALVFDPDLPHTRSQRHLSTLKHPNIIGEFNHFMAQRKSEVARLKRRFGIE